MKAKLLVSLLIIGLVAGLIGGATLAWFTDATEVAPATFTAGTVKVNADGPNVAVPEGKSIKNVNPGDCATVTWNIVNAGTKAAEFRVKLAALWTGVNEELLDDQGIMDNVAYAPAPGSDWVMYEENGEVWLYYTGGPVPGTFNYVANEDGGSEYLLQERTIPLTLVVGFDGALTNNAYQAATFQLGGSTGEGDDAISSVVEAVQASNGAPLAVFGAGWTAVNGENYQPEGLAARYLEYFTNGNGANMPCWNGEEPAEKYTFATQVGYYNDGVFVEDGDLGSLTPDGGSYPADEIFIVLNDANPNDPYWFIGWEVSYDNGINFESYAGPGSNNNDQYTLNFTMPASNVILRAVWEDKTPTPVPTYNVATEVFVAGGGTVSRDVEGPYTAGAPVVLTAAANEGFTFTGWTLPSGLTLTVGEANTPTIGFNVPVGGAALTANFEAITYTMNVAVGYYKADHPNKGSWVPSSHGTVTQKVSNVVNAGPYAQGTEVVLSVTDNNSKDYYKFVKWQVFNGTTYVDANTANPYTYTMPAANAQLRAVFVKQSYKC